jgi:hypothetical protein
MKADGKPTPRRPIEWEYLATLNAADPLDRWQAICKRAVEFVGTMVTFWLTLWVRQSRKVAGQA